MTEDFALIDFALTARSPDEIAEAVAQVRADPAAKSAGNTASQRPKSGFLARFLARRRHDGQTSARKTALSLHHPGTLPPGPITRVLLADTGYASANSPLRLSGPLGEAGLTLIEFREGDGDTSAFCERLSALLLGEELFYFRHSGSRHPGAHFAFHVYQDGRATRRAVSASAEGIAPEAEWFGLDSGMPHPVETDTLPAPGTPNSEIMTPVRQAAILEALGIDPDALFEPVEDLTHVVLEITADPGGAPLEHARGFVHAQREAATRSIAHTHADIGGEIHEQTWEEEVTALLVAAVEAALPEQEQVGWLDGLTARLVAGDIDGALADACAMIAAGNRDEAEKAAAMARLSQLFGRES